MKVSRRTQIDVNVKYVPCEVTPLRSVCELVTPLTRFFTIWDLAGTAALLLELSFLLDPVDRPGAPPTSPYGHGNRITI